MLRFARTAGRAAVAALPAMAAAPAQAHAVADAGAGVIGEVLLVATALGALAIVYVTGVVRQRALILRDRRWQWRVLSFLAGVAVLGTALLPPVDTISAELASMHMLQHILLMVVAPALMVVSAPGGLLLNALPRGLRRACAWTRHSRLARLWSALFRPAVAGSLIGVALLGWHVPAAYDLAVRNEWVHWAEHGSFVAAGLLFWNLLAGTGRLAGWAAPGPLFLLAAMMQTSVLALAMIIAKAPWYRSYLETAHLWGLDPLQDQQLAGSVMWVAGGITMLGVGVALLGRWLVHLEKRYPSRPSASDAHRAAARLGVLALLVLMAGCDDPDTEDDVGWVVPGGNPESGRLMIKFYQCGSCHEIPGIREADGTIGPPLTRFGKRAFIAGAVPNEPDNLITWILDPQTIEPGTVMPSVGASAPEARDIAAYLYSLR